MKWIDSLNESKWVSDDGSVHYRVHQYVRGFSCWRMSPMHHLGTLNTLTAAKAECESDKELQHGQ